MITITLYKNTAERTSMRPALNQVGAPLQGTLRDAASLLNINVTLEADPQDLYQANYMYIAELNRYYHINNVTATRTRLTSVNCSLDPLYTYYNDILNCPGVIGRCESASAHRYLQDNKFSYSVIPSMIRRPFSQAPTNTTLVLMVSAGASQTAPENPGE